MRTHKSIYGQVQSKNSKESTHIDVNFINLIMCFKEKKAQRPAPINCYFDNWNFLLKVHFINKLIHF